MQQHQVNGNLQDPGACQIAWAQSFHTAASEQLPKLRIERKRPWITDRTMHYIHSRNHAHQNHEWDVKLHYNKSIKKNRRQDRQSWFAEILSQGDWQTIHKFRKVNRQPQCSKL